MYIEAEVNLGRLLLLFIGTHTFRKLHLQFLFGLLYFTYNLQAANLPISRASEHLRPGKILALLAFGDHHIGEAHKTKNTSDHGAGWGNAMDWNLLGDYLPG